MKFVFDAFAISTGCKTSKDGKEYYTVNLEQDGELLTLDCTADVAKAIKRFTQYTFVGTYTKGEFNGRVYTRMGVVALSETQKGA